MKHILIMGGICKKLVQHKCLNDFKIVRRIYHPSPISLGESSNDNHNNYAKESLDISKAFDEFLSKNPAEYLVIDLSRLCNRLFKKDGTYYTEPTRDLMSSNFYIGWNETAINPYDYKPEDFLEQFDNFISSILKYYSEKNIVLIHTHHPKWFVVKNFVRKQTSQISQKWIDFFENRFIERTNCNFIDVTKYYFSYKGQTKLSPFVYEGYAYKNIGNALKSLIEDGEIDCTICDYYSYERYIAFYKNLDKKFYNVFFYQDNVIDELVLCCHPDFVSQYIDILVVLRKENFKNINDVKRYFEKNHIESRLYDILCAYCAIKSKQYYLTDVKYNMVFENRMEIPDLLSEIREQAQIIDDSLHVKQINYYNYGYWFFKMQYCLSGDDVVKKNANAYMENYLNDKNINIKPTLVDIWGSCISRLPVNFNDAQIAANTYLFQVTPLGINHEPVSYDPTIFTIGKRNEWRDKLARIELDRTMKTILNASDSKWIILDFFTLTSINIYKYKEQYFNLNPKLGDALSGEVVNFYNNQELIPYVKEQLKEFGDYLRQRYGENIIIVKSRRSLYYENQHDEITNFGNIAVNKLKNEFSNMCNDELAKYLNCFYIDLVEQFLGTEVTLFELTPTHYENELYVEEGRIIQDILEGKIKTKHITTYSNNIRVSRMRKLLKNNKGNPIVNDLFKDKVLDPYVLQMDYDLIERWQDLLVKLYDEEFSTFEEAYKYMKCNNIFTEVLNFIDNLQTQNL